MKILLTNDDGIQAEGLAALKEVFSGVHEIYVIAPDRERSGCSNAFTIHEPLKIRQHEERVFSLSGFPTDCVNVGLKAGIIPRVDCVVSGINHGPNLGDDIFFSGTVGAARMAYIQGLSGYALSLNSRDRNSPCFTDAARFLLSFIEEKEAGEPGVPHFFNINHPALDPSEIRGIRYAEMTKRVYGDSYNRETLAEGEMLLRLVGDVASVGSSETDASLLQQGHITVTPLTTNCNDYERISLYRQRN